MDWIEAVELIADHVHAWRFRELCDEDNPDIPQRDAYRVTVIRLAGGTPPPSVPDITVHYGDPPPQPRRCCG